MKDVYFNKTDNGSKNNSSENGSEDLENMNDVRKAFLLLKKFNKKTDDIDISQFLVLCSKDIPPEVPHHLKKYIKFIRVGEDLKISDIILTADGFKNIFESKDVYPVLNLKFFNFDELESPSFTVPKSILYKMRTYTYYRDPEWHFEYMYFRIIDDIFQEAILILNRREKEAYIYLLNFTDDELLLAPDELKSFLVTISRNFEYISSLKNIMTVDITSSFLPSPESYEEIFDILFSKIQDRVYFLNVHEYLFTTSFIISTYFHEALDTAPYMFYGGEKGSGKTRALETIADYSYRASESSSLTPAVIAREIEWHRTTLILDEMVRNENRSTDVEDHIYGILRSGIRRGQKYKRMVNDKDIGVFDVFGPKAIATNRNLPDDILDRCLINVMFKNVKFTPVTIVDKRIIEFLSEFRFLFLCLDVSKKFRSIIEKLRNTLIRCGVEPRFAEIITPLLFFIPRKYHDIDMIKNKLEVKFDEEKYTETFNVYMTLKTILESMFAKDDGVFTFDFFEKQKEVELKFNDIFRKYMELHEIDYERISEREKRSLSIRIGLILKNRFGFKTVRKTERVTRAKVKYIIVNIDKFKSFYDRYETEIEIGETEIKTFFEYLREFTNDRLYEVLSIPKSVNRNRTNSQSETTETDNLESEKINKEEKTNEEKLEIKTESDTKESDNYDGLDENTNGENEQEPT